MKKSILLLMLVLLTALFVVSCSGATSSTSIGGAVLELGTAHNEDLKIDFPQTSFAPGEDFYVSFDNNASFNTNFFILEVEDVNADEIIAEIRYDVDPEWSIVVTELLYIPDPGKYKFSAIVDSKTRATQDIIIE